MTSSNAADGAMKRQGGQLRDEPNTAPLDDGVRERVERLAETLAPSRIAGAIYDIYGDDEPSDFLRQDLRTLLASQGRGEDARLPQVLARTVSLIDALMDSDPSDLVADGGVTVLDVLRHDGRALRTEILRIASPPTQDETASQGRGEPDQLLNDPAAVHLNMLRGSIAMPSPTSIAHLYRGEEAAQLLAELLRQHPHLSTDQGRGGAPAWPERAEDLDWLERQRLSGHCGEENSEARHRYKINARIDRLLTVLDTPDETASLNAGAGTPQLDRVFIGDGEYVRADEAVRQVIAARSEAASLKARVEELEGALTPSGETKAAYHGEFKFEFEQFNSHSGDWELAPVHVPWTTIKEIMAAIRDYAALQGKPVADGGREPPRDPTRIPACDLTDAELIEEQTRVERRLDGKGLGHEAETPEWLDLRLNEIATERTERTPLADGGER